MEDMKTRGGYLFLPYETREKLLELWGTKPADKILEELGIPTEKKAAIYSLISKERKTREIKDGRAFMRAN